LAGGEDAFPWGTGGGLDVDLLDGKHANEIGFTDPYYVVTKAYAQLVNAKIHPNTGSPNYNVKHEFTDIEGIISAAQHGVFTTGDLHQDYLLASGARALTGNLAFSLNQALDLVLEKRTTAPGLREYLNTGDTTHALIYSDTWESQTFTPSVKHTIKKVRLKLAKVGNPTWTLTIGIRATSAGEPVGSDLCSGTLDSSTLTTTPTWYDISLGAGTTLEANTQYAIVVRLAGGNGSNYITWRLSIADLYPGGACVWSIDGGLTWTIAPTYDLMFEEYADIEAQIWFRTDLDRVSYSPDGLVVWRVPKSIDGIDVDSHVSRHHSGGADPLALASIAGIITDSQHGSRGSGLHADSHVRLHALDSALDHSGTITDAQHGTKTTIPDAHHGRSHDHSLAADGSPIAVAGVPSLPASKITSERFPMPRMPDGTSGYVLTAKGSGVDPAYEAPVGGAAHDVSHVEGTTDISKDAIGFTLMDDMTITKTFGAHRNLIFFKAGIQATVIDTLGEFRLRMDGGILCDNQWAAPQQGANVPQMVFIYCTNVVSAGSHTYEILWRRSAGTGQLWNYSSSIRFRRMLTVIELLL